LKTYLFVVWGVDSWLGENTIEDQTDGNTTWDTDESSLYISTIRRGREWRGTYHGRITSVPVSVCLEGRGQSLEFTIGTLNLESVL
jgi:hypothetical protein